MLHLIFFLVYTKWRLLAAKTRGTVYKKKLSGGFFQLEMIFNYLKWQYLVTCGICDCSCHVLTMYLLQF